MLKLLSRVLGNLFTFFAIFSLIGFVFLSSIIDSSDILEENLSSDILGEINKETGRDIEDIRKVCEEYPEEEGCESFAGASGFMDIGSIVDPLKQYEGLALEGIFILGIIGIVFLFLGNFNVIKTMLGITYNTASTSLFLFLGLLYAPSRGYSYLEDTLLNKGLDTNLTNILINNLKMWLDLSIDFTRNFCLGLLGVSVVLIIFLIVVKKKFEL